MGIWVKAETAANGSNASLPFLGRRKIRLFLRADRVLYRINRGVSAPAGKTVGLPAGLCLALVLGFSLGCATSEGIFAGDRIENLCNDALPVCGQRAGCVLTADEYLAGRFPGGQRLIVRTPTDSSRLLVRIFLDEQVFPGTELQIRAGNTGCDGFDQVLQRDIDLFELAGESQTLERELEVEGRGDHLVEFFSDMASSFFLTIDVDEL